MGGHFIKTTKLNGPEKAAILFAELGTDATDGLLKYLTTDQIRKLRLAYKYFGNGVDVYEELQVLEETLRFGMNQGLTDLTPDIFSLDSYKHEHNRKKQEAIAAVQSDPAALASVLNSLLSEKE